MDNNLKFRKEITMVTTMSVCRDTRAALNELKHDQPRLYKHYLDRQFSANPIASLFPDRVKFKIDERRKRPDVKKISVRFPKTTIKNMNDESKRLNISRDIIFENIVLQFYNEFIVKFNEKVEMQESALNKIKFLLDQSVDNFIKTREQIIKLRKAGFSYEDNLNERITDCHHITERLIYAINQNQEEGYAIAKEPDQWG